MDDVVSCKLMTQDRPWIDMHMPFVHAWTTYRTLTIGVLDETLLYLGNAEPKFMAISAGSSLVPPCSKIMEGV